MKDFFTQQSKDLKSSLRILLQQNEESSARDEIQAAPALGHRRQAVRFP